MIHRDPLLPLLLISTVFFAAAPAPAQSCQGQGWQPQIGRHTYHAMAYDSGRGVTVLFGGQDHVLGGKLSETWEWDGEAWTLRASSGPSARSGHAMAYDSARGVTVLFGGTSGGNQTWEWNGSAWSLRATSGPAPRRFHEMVYDSARGVTVLFGGDDGGLNFKGDTWEWDGSTWTQRATTGPSSRGYYGMAYDSARGVTVLFGGSAGSDETWEWDGTTWTQQVVSGPPARSRHAMAYDSARRVSVLFGGIAPGGYMPLGDLWEFDGDRRAWSTNYGSGWPGTNGVPSFTSGDPVLCTTVTLDLGNSPGANTTAGIFIGLAATDVPTNYDGHLLVTPTKILILPVPAGGLALPAPVPCDPALCGLAVYLQSLEVDPGASQGLSFTRGLRLVLGS